MKKILFLLFFSNALATVSAQDDNRVEAFKKEYITKELQLTETESNAFFPVYQEYSQKRKEARRSMRAEMRSVKAEQGEPSVEKIMDQEQNMVDIQKEYFEKFKSIIPEKKVIQLMEVEKKFKLMLMQRLKEKR